MNECNRIKINDFNFIIIYIIIKDGKKNNKNNFYLDKRI